MTCKVLFDVRELYYLTQYLPVYEELNKRGAQCLFVVYDNPACNGLLFEAIEKEQITARRVDGEKEALNVYLEERADWVIFGNTFFDLDTVHTVSKSAQLGHGVGPKMSYYTKSGAPMTVRFVEGDRRMELIQKRYPEGNFVQTGFAKLDPLLNKTLTPFSIEAAGLDKNKKTLLYAPTFYPSSLECFSNHWPAHFSEYNLIVKPHSFSVTKQKYKAQKKKIEIWSKASNVYVAGFSEHSLLPFMGAADILISEASSALFEFAAMDKPIVWCDFLKLRWNYRGLFKYRFTRRMDPDIFNYHDLGKHAKTYKSLKQAVKSQLDQPDEFKAKRAEYTRDLVGLTDGKASQRITDYLLKH